MAFPSPALSASYNLQAFRRRQKVASSVAPGRIDRPIRKPRSSASLLPGYIESIPMSFKRRKKHSSSSLQPFPSTSRLDQYSAGLYIAYQAIGSAFSAWSRESLAWSAFMWVSCRSKGRRGPLGFMASRTRFSWTSLDSPTTVASPT